MVCIRGRHVTNVIVVTHHNFQKKVSCNLGGIERQIHGQEQPLHVLVMGHELDILTNIKTTTNVFSTFVAQTIIL